MIHKATLDFLTELKLNNNKPWFDANRSVYQKARENFLQLTTQLIQGISQFDPAVGQTMPEPKNCVKRINRDIRFSKDKTPYKTNFFAYIHKGDKKSPYAGYYMNLDPEDSFIGGGIYMPEPAVLNKIRRRISSHAHEWNAIITYPDFIKQFTEVKPSGKLTRPPKGYDKDDPVIEYLKYKGYYTHVLLDYNEILRDDLLDRILLVFKQAKPLIDFINTAIDA